MQRPYCGLHATSLLWSTDMKTAVNYILQ